MGVLEFREFRRPGFLLEFFRDWWMPPIIHPGWRKLSDSLTDVSGFGASSFSEIELLRAAHQVTRSERSSAQAAGLAATR